ncbi:phage tail sheath subtilisin-like domain-containing protein [Brevundimonas sp.]|uniref:phage tail sheath subtilisin-like domain-containing protein n=1 Tax=Brevundimonas sp. TaxID=1871086 RepID=UPI003D6D95D6
MSISFNSIPLDLRTPGQYLEFDASRARSGAGVQPQRVLVVGQKLAAGLANAGQPTRIATADQAVQQFGRGSMLALMFAAFLTANSTAEAWGLALADNAAGVAATKTVTVSGPATAAGIVNLYVAGVRVQAAVAAADTATVVATALADAINDNPDLPVTAASAAAVVTLTCRHKGAAGEALDVRVNYRSGETLPAGLAVAVAAGATGAGNPDMAAVFTAIGDDWFNTFVNPYTDTANLDLIDAELAERFGPLKMIDGFSYSFSAGTFGALTALGSTRNGPHVSIGGLKGSPTWSPVIAAAYAGVVSYHGAIDPARPFQTLPLPGVLAPTVNDRFTREERDLLLREGISTFTVDAGGQVLIERPITTYQTNAFGLPDTAYLDVNTLLTLSYLRWSMRARIATKYGRHKLANDGTLYGSGQAIVTPKVIKAELISLFREWETAGLVENLPQFIADLIVQRDPNDPNRLNALIPPDLVNQFRVFAGQVQFRV